MFCQVVARSLLLSTVFLWTVQPTLLRTFAVAETCNTCSIELDEDVELDQFCALRLTTRIARVAIDSYSAARPEEDVALTYEMRVGPRLRLRGPPVVSFS